MQGYKTNGLVHVTNLVSGKSRRVPVANMFGRRLFRTFLSDSAYLGLATIVQPGNEASICTATKIIQSVKLANGSTNFHGSNISHLK
jgi:hypothetical protein